MKNFPPEIYQQIQEAICRPNGTVTFIYTSKGLFDPGMTGGIIVEIISKSHLFRLERDPDLNIHYYHSSPGTGTRVATVDLKQLTPVDDVFFGFTWSPNEIKLYVGSQIPGDKLLSATGSTSKKQFQVGTNGSVFQIGGENIEVMGANVYVAGKPILLPTAIEAWRETKKAIEILSSGKSEEGHIFDTAITNLTLAILVTGFEAYSKKRLVEIEREGIAPDIQSLISSFFSQKQREAGILDVLKAEADEAKKSILEIMVDKDAINFQNYDKCKLAFNKAYNIKFGDLGLDSIELEKIQKFIKYRHRIIHVSALSGILNLPDVPPEEPVFPKRELAKEATEAFDKLIAAIHGASLKLKRVD